MDKQKVLLHSVLYDLKPYKGWRKYRIIWTKPVDKLLASNNNLVLNFEEAKDHRSEGSRDYSDPVLDISALFPSAPTCDFTFNQTKNSPTNWEIDSHRNYYSSSTKPSQTQPTASFTFAGNIEEARFEGPGQFKSVNLTQQKPPKKLQYDNETYSSTTVRFADPDVKNITLNDFKALNFHVENENNNVETIKINNCFHLYCQNLTCHKMKELKLENIDEVNISRIKSNAMTSIVFNNIKSLHLDITSFRLPNIKTMDLSHVKSVKMFDSVYNFLNLFSSLNLNYSPNSWDPDKPIDDPKQELASDLDKTKQVFNPACKIKLNPEGYITCYALPNHSSFLPKEQLKAIDHNLSDTDSLKTYKVKDIFHPNAQGEYIITLYDLVKIFHKTHRQEALNSLSTLDKLISSLPSTLHPEKNKHHQPNIKTK